MYKLIKLSKPTFTIEFMDEDSLRDCLYTNVCSACRDIYGESVKEMLASDCGCEYEIDGFSLDGHLTHYEYIQHKYES